MNTRDLMLGKTLVLLLPLFQTSHSLSSQSPPDPLAYPKYSVSLSGWDDAITNQTATAFLNNPQSQSQDDDAIAISNPNSGSFLENPTENGRHTLMRTASGQAFICTLPPLPQPVSSKSKTALANSSLSSVGDLERKSERLKIEEDGLKNGLKLISSLKDRCIYTRLGWFTYSFCYGKGEIRQFHGLMIPGYSHPQEDPNQDIYILGFHIDHHQHPHHQAKLEGTLPAPTIAACEGELTSLGRNRFSSGGGPVPGSISDVLRDDTVIRSSVEKEEEEFQSKRYLVQRWDGGTICDMTGKPRSVEVQFHCSTLGSDHIALLRETSICEYLMVIHTPRLCSEPLFLDGGARKGIGSGELVTDIGCRPVLTDEEIEKWKATDEARKKAQENKKNKAHKSLEETSSSEKTNKLDAAASSQPLDADTSSPEDTKKSDSSDVPSEGSAQSDILPSSEDAKTGLENQEELPPSSLPEQIVLGKGESTGQTDPKSGSKSSDTEASTQTSEEQNAKPVVLEVDPITVYFDADTGKMYMDDPKNRKASEATDADTRSLKSNHENQGSGKGKNTAQSDQADRSKNQEVELGEIAKALRESLGALLKDLRAEEEGADTKRTNKQAKPKSFADILASFKDLDSTAKRDSKHRNLKNSNPSAKPPAWEDIKKLSSESHSKLVEMYQQKFDIPSDNHAPPQNQEEEETKDKK